MAELYDELGVEPGASTEEIRRAFRRLSLTYHPDRRLQLDEKREAGTRWLRVAAAYDVLSDERKRMVYDELGAEHYEQGLTLLTPQVDSAAKVRRAFEKAQRRSLENEFASRMRTNGSVVFSASASELIEPADPDVPLQQRTLPGLTSVAIAEDVLLALDRKNSLEMGCQLLTKGGLGGSTLRLGFKRVLSHHASLHLGTALDGSPLSLVANASRRISRHSRASLGATLSTDGISGLTLLTSRQLTRRTLGEVTWTLGGLTDDGSLTLRLARTSGKPRASKASAGADDSSEAGDVEDDADVGDGGSAAEAREERECVARAPMSISNGVAGEGFRAPLASLLERLQMIGATLRAALRRARLRLRQRLSRSGAELCLKRDGPRAGVTLMWRHSCRSRSKLALRYGAGFLRTYSITLSSDRIISMGSHSGVGLTLQVSNRGLMIKLRLQRYSKRLLLPVYLAANPTAPVLLVAAAVPSVVIAAARRYLIVPHKDRRRRRELQQEKAEARKEADQQLAEWQDAQVEMRLLAPEATTRAQEERERDGLLILAAFYGDVQAAPPAAEDTSAQDYCAGTYCTDRLPRWIDVRTALQYLVVDSALVLPARSKRTLRGFAPTATADAGCAQRTSDSRGGRCEDGEAPCELWIRYQLGSEVHSVCVADDEPLRLGRSRGSQ